MVFVSLRTMLFILFAMLILTLVGGQFVAAFFVAAFIAFVIWRMRWGQRKNKEYAEIARNRISAENQTGKSERSTSTMRHATATQTTKAAALSVAQLIGETFSSSRFTELFKDESFADGWKLGDALAVWYFLGTVSLDAAVWTTFDSRDQAWLIVDTCYPFLSKRWNMSESVLQRFKIVKERFAKAAFFGYVGCKSTEDYIVFFSRLANLVLGADLPADRPFEGTTMECMLKGYEPVSLDPSLGLPISHLFTNTTIEAKKLLQEPAIAWLLPQSNNPATK